MGVFLFVAIFSINQTSVIIINKEIKFKSKRSKSTIHFFITLTQIALLCHLASFL